MPAEGFIWALKVGYVLFLWEQFSQYIGILWDHLRVTIQQVVQVLHDCGLMDLEIDIREK